MMLDDPVMLFLELMMGLGAIALFRYANGLRS